MIKDSGERTEYETGAVRDIKEGKGRCDLLPMDVISRYFCWDMGMTTTESLIFADFDRFKSSGDIVFLFKAIQTHVCEDNNGELEEAIIELSKHFEEGALKYGENNWQKGIPVHSYIDSAIRHYLKYRAGYTDEPHDRAFIWNIVCCIWTMMHHPELDDFTEKEKANEL